MSELSFEAYCGDKNATGDARTVQSFSPRKAGIACPAQDCLGDPKKVLIGTHVTLLEQLVGLIQTAHVFCRSAGIGVTGQRFLAIGLADVGQAQLVSRRGWQAQQLQ